MYLVTGQIYRESTTNRRIGVNAVCRLATCVRTVTKMVFFGGVTVWKQPTIKI